MNNRKNSDPQNRVSDSESFVLKALWEKNPQTADEIVERVAPDHGWSPATVKTLLNRLLKKKAIQADKDGRKYLYRPLVTREAYVESESRGLLDRLFDGQLAPLVSHFSEKKGLSPQDVEALKKLVEDLDDDR